MRIYLAGNFVQTNSVESEFKVMKKFSKDWDFNRLFSFFYKKPWLENLIKARIKMEGESSGT
jgi:hypothetical protein